MRRAAARVPHRGTSVERWRRQVRTGWSLLLVTSIACAVACWSRPLPVDPRANVLLITLDTTRADRIGAYGYAKAETPYFDALAAEGNLFRHAVSTVPLTLPAHTCLMTGAVPSRHGVRDNGGYFLDGSWTTLAESLHAEGYQTFAAVGAFVLHHLWGLNQGFDTYDDQFDTDETRARDLLRVQRSGAEVVDRGLEFLASRDDRPFFLWLHLYDPHHPYTPAEPYASRHPGRPYDGEIAYTDAQVGRVIDYLRSTGLDSRTLIVIAGDHGEGLNDHAEPDHGIFLYDSTLRIPLVIRTPLPLFRGEVLLPVSDIDLMPTVLGYLGVAAPDGVQGRSLLPAMAGRTMPERTIYSESRYARLHYGWSELAAIRDARFKFIEAPRPELYDLVADPGELTNLVGAMPEAVARLRQELVPYTAEAAAGGDDSALDTLDTETLDKLRSLGYVGSQAPVVDGPLADPKDKVEAMNLLIHASRDSGQMLDEGRFADAVTLLERVLDKEPNYMDGYLNLATAHRKLGRIDAAIAVLERARALTPDSVNLLQSLARCHRDRGDSDAAIAVLKSIIARSPRYPQAHLALAEVWVEQSRFEDAIRQLETLLAEHPQSALALYEIGMVHLRLGRLVAARDRIREALAVEPRLRSAHFNLGVIAEQMGDTREARREYALELEQFPLHLETWTNLGLSRLEDGDLSGAKQAFETLIEINPEFAPGHYLLARSHFLEGRRDARVRDLVQRALELDPGMVGAKRLMAELSRAG